MNEVCHYQVVWGEISSAMIHYIGNINSLIKSLIYKSTQINPHVKPFTVIDNPLHCRFNVNCAIPPNWINSVILLRKAGTGYH